MPAIDFNVAPYNDDWSASKKFYRILFRPEAPVQARELTQLQTILQNQISRFGDHIFKHGSVVTGGAVSTNFFAGYVRLKPSFGELDGNPVPINIALFTDKIIESDVNGIEAQVLYVVDVTTNDPPTLYVSYLNSGRDGKVKTFQPGEQLRIKGTQNYLMQVDDTNPTGLAALGHINSGVYYIRGIFANVDKQTIILNKYNNIFNGRMGLKIVESIVAPEEDLSLLDNAQGFYNYAAAGAHRYKIDLVLESRSLDITDDTNFVELYRYKESVVQRKVDKTVYNVLADELARRTYDESGDYTVRPFGIDVREHLDTSFVASGTAQSGTALILNPPNPEVPATIVLALSASATDDDYNGMQVYIADGKGAGQKRNITTYVGATRTASVDTDWDQYKTPDSTSTFVVIDPTKINRGIYPPPTGNEAKLAVGIEPGKAYVNGYEIETQATKYVDVDKARDSSLANNSIVNTALGNYFLVKNISNVALPAQNSVNRNYLQIAISRNRPTVADASPLAAEIMGYARVRSIEFHQGIGPADPMAVFKMYVFDVQMNSNEDINLARHFFLFNTSDNSNGGSAVACYGDICTSFQVRNVVGAGLVPAAVISGPNSIGTEKVVSYSPQAGILLTEPIAGTGQPITGTGQGSVSSTTFQIISRRELNEPEKNLLVYPLNQTVVKTLKPSGVADTSYTVRRVLEVQANGSAEFIFSSPDAPFMPYNQYDYLAIITDSGSITPGTWTEGTVLDLSVFDVTFPASNPPNSTLMIKYPSTPIFNGKIKLVCTVHKPLVVEKKKQLNKYLANAANTFKTFTTPTPILQLDVCDVLNARVLMGTQENVDPVLDIPTTWTDVTNRYTLDDGQRDNHYALAKLTLRAGQPSPPNNISVRVYYDYFVHSGTGDYFSVDSYKGQVNYADIPVYTSSTGKKYPLRDCLDFRPRMDNTGINFVKTGASFSDLVKPNDVVICDYEYYLDRIDKIFIDRNGEFHVIRGNPSLTPVPPENPKDGMLLYTLAIEAYTINTKAVKTRMTENKRYTMRDIGKLEKRIENLEYYTSLNLLEKDTADMKVTDTTTGLDRFKNGFIVDNFKNHNIGNVYDSDYHCSIDPVIGEMRPEFIQDNINLEFVPQPISSGYKLVGPNNDVIILQYTEKEWVKQPYSTRIENVNPFAIFGWAGTVTLDPPTDTWRDTTRAPDILVNDDSAYNAYIAAHGTSSVVWNDWQTTWTGETIETVEQLNNAWTGVFEVQRGTEIPGTRTGPFVPGFGVRAQIQIDERVTQTRNGVTSRTGTRTTVVPNTVRTETTDRVISVQTVPFIRNRIVKFIGKRMKPNTRVYPFFDSVAISKFIRPTREAGMTDATFPLPQFDSTYLPVWNDPLYTNGIGTVTGDFDIPNRDDIRFRVGTRIFRLTSDPLNGQNPETWGDATYTAAGLIETRQATITSIREPRFVTENISESQSIHETNVFTRSTIIEGWVDPLAETFLCDMKGGMFLTRVDLYFASKDDNIPVTLQIRNVENGYPGKRVLPFGEATLYPQTIGEGQIYTSDDGSAATTFHFPAPVYLEEKQEYCLVVMANSTKYLVHTARMGETAFGSTNVVSQQPYAGVMFKSQNASTWTAEQLEDIKFTLYRASFDPLVQANVYFQNEDKSTYGSLALGGADNSPEAFITLSGTASTVDDYYKGQFVRIHSTAAANQEREILSYNGTTKVATVTPAWTVVPGVDTFYSVGPRSLTQTWTILDDAPFQTVEGSNVVRVFHGTHGMPKGLSKNSVVIIGNVLEGSYNGIPHTDLMGQFVIDNVELDAYTIETSTSATASGKTGPSGVFATQNRQYDVLYPIASQMVVAGTAVDWQFKTTSGKSPHNNAQASQNPYDKDQTFAPVTVNQNVYFKTPRVIASTINETQNIAGASTFDKKSAIFQATMSTTAEHLSPMIDSKRLGLICVNNRIDDPNFTNITLASLDQGVVVNTGLTPYTMAIDAATGCLSWEDANDRDLSVFKPGHYITVIGDAQNLKDFSHPIMVKKALVDKLYLDVTTVELTGTGTGAIVYPVVSNGAITAYTVEAGGAGYTAPTRVVLHGPGRGATAEVTLVGDAVSAVNVIDGGSGYVSLVSKTGVSTIQLTQYDRFVDELSPEGCSSKARYITRRFTLKDAANSLQLNLTVNRPIGSYIDVYYRILKADTNDPFDDQPYILMELDTSNNTGESVNSEDYREYQYAANQIGNFIAFSFKIVMRGGNSAQVPRIRDLRGIALGT